MLATFAAFETDVRHERRAGGSLEGWRQAHQPRPGRGAQVQRVGPSAIAHEMRISRRQVYRISGEDA